MKGWLIGLPRHWKRTLLICLDLLFLESALVLAFIIRLNTETFITLFKEGFSQGSSSILSLFLIAPATVLPFLIQSGIYSAVNRFNSSEATGSVVRSLTLGLACFAIVLFILPGQHYLPRSVPIIWWALSITLIAGSRYWVGKWLHGDSLSSLLTGLARPNYRSASHSLPVAIYGAGAAGRQLLAALRQGYQYNPVAFVDDDEKLHHSLISGLRVYGPGQIKKMLSTTQAKEILLAVPSATPSRRRQMIEVLEPYGLSIKTMPGLEEIAQGKVRISGVREVSINDILGRDPVEPIPELFAPCIEQKVVLVTGAGGSIGAELCRQIIKAQPTQLILLDNSEYNLYQIDQELSQSRQRAQIETDLVPILASVTQPKQINEIIKKFSVQTIYHAAAYKHVPIVEHNAFQGFRNNVLGTLYSAQSALLNGVEHFVLISTDKAVRPTNIMGATKRLSELVLQALSLEKNIAVVDAENFGLSPTIKHANSTRFTMVRFGNVLDSSGSVIPKFREQIKSGGPLTVTHPDITRYFMTIPEAAQLVIQSGAMGRGGEVFVLDMGDPVKIDRLARELVNLSGLSVKTEGLGEGDIEVTYTGLRPGEKLYEELLIEENSCDTNHPKIKRATEKMLPWEVLCKLIEQLNSAFDNHDHLTVRKLLVDQTEIAYTPQDSIIQ